MLNGSLCFVPAPTQAEGIAILDRIVTRVKRWLARKGLVRDADQSNALPELPLPAEALVRDILHTVRIEDGTRTRDDVDAERAGYAAQEKQAVFFERFNSTPPSPCAPTMPWDASASAST